MKVNINPFLLITIGMVILCIGYFVGCQANIAIPQYQQRVILDSGPGLENIQSVTDVFLKAWNKRDATGCAKTYAKNAIFMPQDQVSVEGRSNIQKLFNDHEWDVADGTSMNIEEKVEEVIYFDDWAVMRGLGKIMVAEVGLAESKSNFKWVMLSKKNEEGKWESVWDIFNYDNLQNN